MPETYNAMKQGPRELPDGHPHKGGAVYFKPKSPPTSQPPSATPEQSSAPTGDMSDPMRPLIDKSEEALKKDFGDRYNPKA